MKNRKIFSASLFLFCLSFYLQGCIFSQKDHTHETYSPRVKARIYTIGLEPSEYQRLSRIVISGPVIHPPREELSNSDLLNISLTIVSDTERGVRNFLNDVKDSHTDDERVYHIDLLHHWRDRCEYRHFGGEVSVEGICVEDLVIALPKDCPTKVIIKNDEQRYSISTQNNKVIREQFSGDTVAEFLSLIRQTALSKDRLLLLKHFSARHPGRIFYVSDAGVLLSEIYADRMAACEILSGRIIDTENVHQLSSSFPFESGRENGLRYLSR